MKTLRITYLELIDLEVSPAYTYHSYLYIELWIKNKLKEAGFDLTKEYRSSEDLTTQDIIFTQK